MFRVRSDGAVVGNTDLILYIDAKFSDSLYADFFVVLFTTVNSEKQISDQTGQDLDHQAVLASRDQMVYFEMAFPPGKEFLDVPSQLINVSSHFCVGDPNMLWSCIDD
jgi:hypothetical protein